MKMYYIKNEMLVNAERYLDKLKFRYEVEFEKWDLDLLGKEIYKLENALLNAKANATGYTARANGKDFSVIRNASLEREMLDYEIETLSRMQ